MIRNLVLRLVLICGCFIVQEGNAEIILDYVKNCNASRSPVTKIKFSNASIENNTLKVAGSAYVSQNMGASVSVLHYSIGSEVERRDIALPDLCLLLMEKTAYGNKMGELFVPKMRCPTRKGNYKFNATISLEHVVGLPKSDVKYSGELVSYDVSKNVVGICLEVSWSVK